MTFYVSMCEWLMLISFHRIFRPVLMQVIFCIIINTIFNQPFVMRSVSVGFLGGGGRGKVSHMACPVISLFRDTR